MTDIGSLMREAAILMVTGMSVVFVFLTTLIYIVRLISKLVPEELPPQTRTMIQRTTSTNTTGVKPEVVAAISAAVQQYRSAKQN
ncbi:MAG: oxaloacetate decarboxylase subunit gamma [Aliivibrio sp.]|uniref:oxaloacetate decarboxylase subunit gamma n=1 Tax=Aliivibrio sp. TaxID=1872443 RepID=UPI001A3B78CD|nr:oxaloacetate decarboxylase subunit gamma [Aliivibrio sp.]